MPPAHMQLWVKRLVRGEEGETIVRDMRDYYSTDCSLMTRISEARRLYMAATPDAEAGERNRHPTLQASLDKLRREEAKLEAKTPGHPCAELIRDFLACDLRTMYAEWRRRTALAPDCGWTAPVQRIFGEMRVLPDTMTSFRADDETIEECKAGSEEARLQRNEEQTVIEDADAILKRFVALLDAPAERTLSELIIGLCATSGRRLGEVVSPHSSFTPMDNYSRGVRFAGQLKRTSVREAPAYDIPLVGLEAPAFLAARADLRRRQDDELAQRTQAQVSSVYQSNARRYLIDHFQEDGHPIFRKLHELRGFYASCAWQSFKWGRLSQPRVSMYILGHQSMRFFTSYVPIDVRGLTAKYGAFPVDVASLRVKRDAERGSLKARKAREAAAA